MYCKMTTSAMAMAVLVAGPAMADVTPDQVWQSWVDYYEASGLKVTEGAREVSGNNLTVKDVTFAFSNKEATVNFVLPSVALEDAGSGTVKVVMSDTMSGTASIVDPDAGDTIEMVFSGEQKGNQMLVSGTPEEQKYDVSLPESKISLDKVKSSDVELNNVGSVNFIDTTGTYAHSNTPESKKIVQALKTAKVEVIANFDVPKTEHDAGGKVDFTASIEGLDITSDILMPTGVKLDDFAAALNAGAVMHATFLAGPYSGKGTIESQEDGAPKNVSFDWVTDGFDLALNMAKEGLGYKGSSKGAKFNMTTDDLPFPISFANESAHFDIMFPVSKSDEEQPFKMAYGIAGLTISDQLWAMFDPQAVLPRDPATIDFDISGKAKVTADLLDPAAMDGSMNDNAEQDDAEEPLGVERSSGPDMPFVPSEVTLNKVYLNAVGAKVDMDGALTFSEPAMDPVGKINGTFEGVNALLNNLVQMGLVEAEEVQGYRMMLAMFAKPVEGQTDALRTELEFKEGGSIFANGVQVQ